MKKTYLRAAIASLGLFTGVVFVDAQTAAGGGSGAAAGTASSATASGTAAGRAAPSGTANTIGGASIARPAGAQPVGAASVIQANPNNAASGVNSGGIAANPVNSSATATLPTGVPSATGPAVQFNTLPANVRSTLQGFSANGSLGSVTAIPGQAGGFRATVTQNGVPMELTIAPNGQVVSRTPVTGSPTSMAGAGTLNADAGIPLNNLPPAVASSIQSQLGGAPVQSVSRDDLANGSVFRVTTTQNGVPTEMRFAANGTLLSSTPLAGSTTSPFLGGGGTIVPGAALVMDDLPRSVQDAVRNQLGNLEASRIMQARGTNGINYLVSYTQDGRPMTMVVGPDGRILSNGPANVSAAATRNIASTAGATNTTRNGAVTLDQLPESVENALKQKAPYAEVRTITREQRVGGDVYVVAVRDGDRAGEIVIDANGKIIRDNRRDLSALTPSTGPALKEKQEGMPYDQLPVAIQNAIKAYATASDLRSITLGLDRDGKTVYDVIFYRDGRRDRMIVDKRGKLVRIEEDVSPALELASNKPAVLAIGDLPEQVQDTVRRQTDKVVVKDIQTKEVGGETVYQVNYSTNGAPRELLVSNKGEVVLPQGDRQNDKAGAALQTDVDKNEPDPVRVIDGSKSQRDNTASGAFATTERATSASNSAEPRAAATEVKLSETPQSVQNTVKKLAASGTIQRVTPKLGPSGITYEVSFMEDGKPRTVAVDRNGVIQNQKATTSVP
jgi:hypothetical protein